jgi:hypothetical protein
MSELPLGMLQGDRPAVPHFHRDEILFRRVPPDFWVDDAKGVPVEEDAISLPDMSVGRSLLAHPEWLRLDKGCEDWAVIGFAVHDIPQEQWLDGARFAIRPEHVPERRNYPHSEVRVYSEGSLTRIAYNQTFPLEVQLKWRSRLLRAIRVYLRYKQEAAIRIRPPDSYKVQEPATPCDG